MSNKPSKSLWKTLGLTLGLGLAAVQASADISLGESKANRFGKGETVTPNWSSLHSNPLNNTYQETIRVMSACVNGRSFVVALGMAGVWDTTNNAGAGAGAGAGIIQVFDTDSEGNMVPVACN